MFRGYGNNLLDKYPFSAMELEASLSWLAMTMTPGIAARLSARLLREFDCGGEAVQRVAHHGAAGNGVWARQRDAGDELRAEQSWRLAPKM